MQRNRLLLLVLLPALAGPAPDEDGKDPDNRVAKGRRERLLALYTNEAADYTIYRDSSRKEKVELRREPVYVWTNSVRNGGQDGAVFVWTCRGRTEVVGTVFSYPAIGPRNLYHELHSLSLSVLDVARPAGRAQTWTPEAPGIEPKPIPDAPAPARTPAQRLVQMRALTRDFAANSQDDMGRRWELRLLTQPLDRYESTDPDVLDGAVFAFVTSAGTDPEVLLVIEARRAPGSETLAWQYALARFSDVNLWVRHKGREVFTAERLPFGSPRQDPRQRYRIIHDRDIPPVEDSDP
jgi:hypothetical protein